MEQVGTLIAPRTKRWRPGWTVELDQKVLLWQRIHVLESSLAPIAGRRLDLAAGQRVVITAQPMRGATGTLLRRTRLVWRRAWLVKLDEPFGGLKRTRIADEALLPEGMQPSSGHGLDA